ncbi:type I pullulanase [Lactiplantibacillus plantarum]|uniref:type I pullulanase n=1 Tax=Lactiplantibacillus plantarum TaxID=1590 RepID=UPI001AAF3F11|nr:type I pullulanase [Lactiplantibacillus plantarum]MBO2718973.1 type I pullulanase [Lactiplantibacillus plantarum]
MAKTLSFTDTSPQTVKIGDTTTSFTLVCGNDNVATDLTKATSITAKLGNASGYLKSATVDPASLTDPTTGQVTVTFTADLMTSLLAGDYAIEVWVVDSNGTSIYPSDGSTGFTITNNIQSANGSTITTITFNDFVEAMNKAASTIAKGDKGDKGDTGTVDNAGLISAPAFQSLQTQVDDSAVGINLLKGTGNHTFTAAGSWNTSYLSNETTNDLLALFKGLEGQALTVSVDYEYSGFIAGSGDNRLGWEAQIVADTTTYFGPWYYPTNNSGSGRISSTFVVPKNITGIGEGTGFVLFSGSGTGTLSHLKLEKGSVATDWCPNPTEILTQSDYAKGLNTKVTDNKDGTIEVNGSSITLADDSKVLHLSTGDTSARPTGISAGYQYFDTSLNKPIWYTGNNWVGVTGDKSDQALSDLTNATLNNDFTSFDKRWAYAGTDLGFNYSTTGTTFKIWSPTATSVKLISYGTNTNPTAAQVLATPMTRGTSATPNNHATNTIGVWSLTVPGDQNGIVYAYELTFANGTVSDYAGSIYGSPSASSVINTTNDPYSIATTQGGNRSVVVSPENITSNLVLAQGDSANWRVASPTQAIIDELHIHDFTISPTSGVSAGNRGKFLGVIESGTTNPNTGTATGLDYLKNEGFNYIQIMPASQYSSVDETGNRTAAKPNNYNWGYDPQNEMVPEGEYASDSINPVTRINEMKEMVQGLHTNGIGVVMDIVLNHVFYQSESAFEKTVPGYYFRMYTQSGCGNDTASDHEMFGKFVIDSVTYWAKNYDIDGFRFDEMTLLDSTTMNKLRDALTALDPHIIMYGEGWVDSNANNISETSLNNYQKVTGIGFFNPSERDAIVNNNGSADGFASGNTASTTKVARALLASAAWNGNDTLQAFWGPRQSVNYVECHDSYTLNESLWSANPNDSVATHQARVTFANATNILANGITFMEAGQEFGRTKLVNPSNLTQLSPTQIQAYQSGSMVKPAWYPASWDTAKNSYNGLFGLDSNGNYHGNYWPGSNLGTTIVAGDVVNGINWDSVKDYQNAVNFIGNLMKFKKSNPQFWPDDYSKLAFDPTSIGVEMVKNASNGVITEELAWGSTKYLVVLNASGSSVKIGQDGQFYGGSNLTGKTVIISNDSSLTANQALNNSSVTLSDLTATIIQIS